MRTRKQIEASRVNGAKSRGPETSNGIRTDLAHTVLLKGESRHRFDALHRALESELPTIPASSVARDALSLLTFCDPGRLVDRSEW